MDHNKTETITQAITKSSPSDCPEKPHKIDINLALKYYFVNNLSLQDIADKFNVTRQAVDQRIKKVMKLLGEEEDNKAYNDHRAYFLNGIERQLLNQIIDKDKLKKATTGNIAYAVDKINNMRRLELNQSTDNQAVQIKIIRFSDQSSAVDNSVDKNSINNNAGLQGK